MKFVLFFEFKVPINYARFKILFFIPTQFIFNFGSTNSIKVYDLELFLNLEILIINAV